MCCLGHRDSFAFGKSGRGRPALDCTFSHDRESKKFVSIANEFYFYKDR
jgi:hypothetical protein